GLAARRQRRRRRGARPAQRARRPPARGPGRDSPSAHRQGRDAHRDRTRPRPQPPHGDTPVACRARPPGDGYARHALDPTHGVRYGQHDPRPVPRTGWHPTPEGIAMAITIFADNQPLTRRTSETPATLVDRWMLTGISP